jgi:tetratricopeptide (TPR) repeat protein
LAVCVLFFVLAELLLRSLGIPARHPAEDPFVGFSEIHPLYTVKDGKASTAPDRLKYFNEASFPVNKPAGALRIFCLGGSTTYGRPFDGRTSFSKWLEGLLKASDPEREVHVINAGGISYASYRIVPLIREILQYHPDLIVLYTGHNEFLERRTYAGLFDQGRHLITVRALLEKLNTYQALKTILTPLLPKPEKRDGGSGRSGKRDGKKSVLKDEVTAILDRSAGLDLYHRDDAFSQGVIRHFNYNLKTMISLCRNAKVPLILVQPASNLKDFSPFKSEHDVRLTAEAKKRVDEKLRSAGELLRGNRAAEALTMLGEAIASDPLYAESHYWKGKALLALGRDFEARTSFVKAKDLDVCPLRAISPLEEAVDRIAKKERVPVVPFRDFLNRKTAKNGDKSGVPGKESFLDHVHPTIEVHQAIAELILETLAAEKLVHLSRTLGPDDKAAIYANGMKGLEPEFFAVKDLNLAKVLNWAGKKEEARVFLERSAEKLKNNPEVHKMLGGFLLAEKRYDEAVKEYAEAVRASGRDPEMLYSLAVAYSRAGLREKAKEAYAEVMKKAPSIVESFVNLALMHLEEGQTGKALDILREGVKHHPDSPVLFGPYALALAISGNPAEALPWMLKAVEAEPGDPSNFYNLAGIYALLGKSDQAVKTLSRAVDCGYENATKLEEDQVFASIKDLPEFRAVLNRIR